MSAPSSIGRELHMIMRPAGKPRLDVGGLRGIVIHDDVDIEPRGSK